MNFNDITDKELSKATREKHGLSQLKLGDMLGFKGYSANRRISEIERGVRQLISVRRLILLSIYIGNNNDSL